MLHSGTYQSFAFNCHLKVKPWFMDDSYVILAIQERIPMTNLGLEKNEFIMAAKPIGMKK